MVIMQSFKVLNICIIVLVIHVHNGTTELTETTLSMIIKELYNRLDPTALIQEVENANNNLKNLDRAYSNANLPKGHQYSVALLLSKQECDEGKLNSVPTDFKTIRQKMAARQIAQENGVIAAIPQMVITSKTSYTNHAEYRTLNTLKVDNNKVDNNKVDKVDNNKCVIVYTHFSPCTSKCLNDDNKNNIYDLLDKVFKDITPGYKAFVYSTIYHDDIKNQTPQNVFEMFNSIKAVPIYCCYENNKGVVRCFRFNKSGSNTYTKDHCLSQIKEAQPAKHP
ncbi:uncharacterized protein LOC143487829 [Brachyhypopomus gauderio]|uniref:uncharacterized protein LOC143487829 n=1 Tax=Brachyhypopomus gauderio TaxID=698409 RepID=UPI004042959C